MKHEDGAFKVKIEAAMECSRPSDGFGKVSVAPNRMIQ